MGSRTPIGFQERLSANTAENPLKIPMGIPCVILLVLPQSCSLKTVRHPTAGVFALDFCADDAALLTQDKEDKENTNERTVVGLSVLDSPLFSYEKYLWVYRNRQHGRRSGEGRG